MDKNKILEYQRVIEKLQNEIVELRNSFSLKLRSLKQEHESISMKYSKLISEKETATSSPDFNFISKINELESKIR